MNNIRKQHDWKENEEKKWTGCAVYTTNTQVNMCYYCIFVQWGEIDSCVFRTMGRHARHGQRSSLHECKPCDKCKIRMSARKGYMGDLIEVKWILNNMINVLFILYEGQFIYLCILCSLITCLKAAFQSL